MMSEKNTLLLQATPLFSLMQQFSILDFRDAQDCKTLQESIFSLVSRYEKQCSDAGYVSEQVDAAKYALSAFIDEMIMLSNWQDKLTWMSKTLQWHYFGEHSAGEGFYNRLSALRERASDNVDLLELYYVCLQLGFQGAYRLKESASLQQMCDETRNLILRYRPEAHLEGSTNAADEVATEAQAKKNLGILALGLAGGIVIIYCVLALAIHTTASHSVSKLQQYQTSTKAILEQQHNAGVA